MDSTDATSNGSRTALRQPFIDTANALASLYKQAVSAERDAREAGSRAAYMQIMQWAAKKSRAGERIVPAEIINFCAAELAEIQSHPATPASATVDRTSLQSQSTTALGHNHHHSAIQPSRQGHSSLDPQTKGDGGPAPNTALLSHSHVQPQQQVQAVAYVARDDPLVSDIKKLNVNPRKRQRIDISDTFIRSPDASLGPMIFETDSTVRQGNSPSPRRDSKDSRDTPFISANPSEYIRRSKNTKGHGYDKLRKK